MFYLIDKPLWLSSFDVIRELRKKLNTKRIGHAGTLDPLATGCLLIATEKSTKLLPLIEWSKKTYIFSVNIDGTTPSLDLGTPVSYHEKKEYQNRSSEELREFLLAQKEQIPPKYSALHIDGKRAYELARENIEFDIKPRSIEVYSVEILMFTPPIFTIQLCISSGWYVRSFAPIIGEFFWVPGWYITSLRRIEIITEYTTLTTSSAVALEDFSHDKNIGLKTLFPHIESIEIKKDTYQKLIEWRIIEKPPWTFPIIWQLYFMNYDNFYSSLVRYTEDGFIIERNDI